MRAPILLLLLACVCLKQALSVSISRPFLLTNPLPSNVNPCICTLPSDEFTRPCEVRVELQPEPTGEVFFRDALHIVDQESEKQCACWTRSLTTNRTFTATLFCADEPNTVVVLHVSNLEAEAWTCQGVGASTAALTFATCSELSVTAHLPTQAWVTTPHAQTVIAPAGARFTDALAVPRPLFTQANATWTFSPMHARCPPFTVTAHTPATCVYQPRTITANFTENDVVLNTLMWAVILALYSRFLASGSVKHSPVNTLIAMAAVQIGFIACAFSLSYSQLLLSHVLALALFAVFVIVPPCARICIGQKHKLLIPDSSMIWGTFLALVYLIFALIVLLLMLITNK